MRALVPLLLLLFLAAACGGGSNPRSTTTPSSTATATRVRTATPAPTTQAVIPFTPVEEVLTPPPGIDTSGWPTYRDAEHGFELKYPPDAQVTKDVIEPNPMANSLDRGIEIDLPPWRTIEYIFIKVNRMSVNACVPSVVTSPPPPRLPTPDVRLLHASGADFWRTHDGGVAAGNVWDITSYRTAKRTACVSIDAVFSGANFGVVATPPGTDYYQVEAARKAADAAIYTAMISTFRWLD